MPGTIRGIGCVVGPDYRCHSFSCSISSPRSMRARKIPSHDVHWRQRQPPRFGSSSRIRTAGTSWVHAPHLSTSARAMTQGRRHTARGCDHGRRRAARLPLLRQRRPADRLRASRRRTSTRPGRARELDARVPGRPSTSATATSRPTCTRRQTASSSRSTTRRSTAPPTAAASSRTYTYAELAELRSAAASRSRGSRTCSTTWPDVRGQHRRQAPTAVGILLAGCVHRAPRVGPGLRRVLLRAAASAGSAARLGPRVADRALARSRWRRCVWLPPGRCARACCARAQAAQVPPRHRYGSRSSRRAFIDRAHELGKQVHVWTIDDAAEMHRAARPRRRRRSSPTGSTSLARCLRARGIWKG